MFRELERKNKKLPDSKFIEILKNEKRGVLSVIGDGGYPYGMPMNHFYNQNDGCIYFHCGKSGHRIDSLKKNNKASFCVYDSGYCNEGEWALNIKCVIVFGNVDIIDDENIIKDICRKLSEKFTDDNDYINKEISAFASKTLLLRMNPEHICGKIIKES